MQKEPGYGDLLRSFVFYISFGDHRKKCKPFKIE